MNKLAKAIKDNYDEINNLKSQRAGITTTVDKYALVSDNVNELVSAGVNQSINFSDTNSVSDSLSAGDVLNNTETIFTFGIHDEPGFLRLDYGRLDYDRISYLDSKPDDDVEVTIV